MRNFGGSFWEEMNRLVRDHPVHIDRPQGQPHPRYPEMIYPLDYGYVENTTAGDGSGIDVWLGSLDTKKLTGILCTFDTLKSDIEIKLLLGCSMSDLQTIENFYGVEMKILYVHREL
jgi:inorganic pyrophosphatase